MARTNVRKGGELWEQKKTTKEKATCEEVEKVLAMDVIKQAKKTASNWRAAWFVTIAASAVTNILWIYVTFK